MTPEELAALLGPAKVAELETQGHWPPPTWLQPYILDLSSQEPPTFDSLKDLLARDDLIALVAGVASKT